MATVEFSLGRVVATPGALRAMAATAENAAPFLVRHQSGDWGEVGRDDWRANDTALQEGQRILSAYVLKNGTRVWVITEADRSSSCVLLPEEY